MSLCLPLTRFVVHGLLLLLWAVSHTALPARASGGSGADPQQQQQEWGSCWTLSSRCRSSSSADSSSTDAGHGSSSSIPDPHSVAFRALRALQHQHAGATTVSCKALLAYNASSNLEIATRILTTAITDIRSWTTMNRVDTERRLNASHLSAQCIAVIASSLKAAVEWQERASNFLLQQTKMEEMNLTAAERLHSAMRLMKTASRLLASGNNASSDRTHCFACLNATVISSLGPATALGALATGVSRFHATAIVLSDTADFWSMVSQASSLVRGMDTVFAKLGPSIVAADAFAKAGTHGGGVDVLTATVCTSLNQWAQGSVTCAQTPPERVDQATLCSQAATDYDLKYMGSVLEYIATFSPPAVRAMSSVKLMKDSVTHATSTALRCSASSLLSGVAQQMVSGIHLGSPDNTLPQSSSAVLVRSAHSPACLNLKCKHPYIVTSVKSHYATNVISALLANMTSASVPVLSVDLASSKLPCGYSCTDTLIVTESAGARAAYIVHMIIFASVSLCFLYAGAVFATNFQRVISTTPWRAAMYAMFSVFLLNTFRSINLSRGDSLCLNDRTMIVGMPLYKAPWQCALSVVGTDLMNILVPLMMSWKALVWLIYMKHVTAIKSTGSRSSNWYYRLHIAEGVLLASIPALCITYVVMMNGHIVYAQPFGLKCVSAMEKRYALGRQVTLAFHFISVILLTISMFRVVRSAAHRKIKFGLFVVGASWGTVQRVLRNSPAVDLNAVMKGWQSRIAFSILFTILFVLSFLLDYVVLPTGFSITALLTKQRAMDQSIMCHIFNCKPQLCPSIPNFVDADMQTTYYYIVAFNCCNILITTSILPFILYDGLKRPFNWFSRKKDISEVDLKRRGSRSPFASRRVMRNSILTASPSLQRRLKPHSISDESGDRAHRRLAVIFSQGSLEQAASNHEFISLNRSSTSLRRGPTPTAFITSRDKEDSVDGQRRSTLGGGHQIMRQWYMCAGKVTSNTSVTAVPTPSAPDFWRTSSSDVPQPAADLADTAGACTTTPPQALSDLPYMMPQSSDTDLQARLGSPHLYRSASARSPQQQQRAVPALSMPPLPSTTSLDDQRTHSGPASMEHSAAFITTLQPPSVTDSVSAVEGDSAIEDADLSASLQSSSLDPLTQWSVLSPQSHTLKKPRARFCRSNPPAISRGEKSVGLPPEQDTGPSNNKSRGNMKKAVSSPQIGGAEDDDEDDWILQQLALTQPVQSRKISISSSRWPSVRQKRLSSVFRPSMSTRSTSRTSQKSPRLPSPEFSPYAERPKKSKSLNEGQMSVVRLARRVSGFASRRSSMQRRKSKGDYWVVNHS
ncbi:uncharacterized protein LOC135828429 [Sycon ciliatum]|uniref:uncharacterized protein LOC135828429 n=1 Tax=Sycon ciliatum TaxID=27933 RepID=UPI0031F6C876